MNGLGQWSRESARGEPDLRCQGCRRRPVDVETRIDGVPVRLCQRCARVRTDGRNGAGGKDAGRAWLVVVTASGSHR